MPLTPTRRNRAAVALVALAATAAVLCRAWPASADPPASRPSLFGLPFEHDANTKPAPARPAGPTVVNRLELVADDFVVDVYVTGQLLPQQKRTLKGETFGAQAEEDEVDLHPGDWVVLHVACNQLRWEGSTYLGVAGLSPDGSVAFVSDPADHRWSACDDIADVPRFLSDAAHGADHAAVRPDNPWGPGDGHMKELVPGWIGAPIWGTTHSCWLKYTVPAQ